MYKNSSFIRNATYHILLGMFLGGLVLLVVLDSLGAFTPKGGQGFSYPVIETGKKKKDKKKRKENPSVYAQVYVSPDGIVRWTHICCDCALTHKVKLQVISYFGLFQAQSYSIGMLWVVDSALTKDNRMDKWGPLWRKHRDGADEFGLFPAEFGYPRPLLDR